MEKFIKKTNYRQVKRVFPFAAKIVKVDGGYIAFETVEDYKRWKKQK